MEAVYSTDILVLIWNHNTAYDSIMYRQVYYCLELDMQGSGVGFVELVIFELLSGYWLLVMSERDMTRLNNLVCTHRSVCGVRIHVAVGLSLASTDTNWPPELNCLNVPQIVVYWLFERRHKMFYKTN